MLIGTVKIAAIVLLSVGTVTMVAAPFANVGYHSAIVSEAEANSTLLPQNSLTWSEFPGPSNFTIYK